VGPSRRAETLGLRREQGRYREVVEEIITAFSRIRWLFVIARNSSFTYKGRAVDEPRTPRASPIGPAPGCW
jgi:TolB-like protein